MDRYKKQKLVREIGDLGQKLLGQSHVTIVGCGGLGTIVGPYLAGAGVGHILLIDHDVIALDNLHRQVFFSEKDIGKSKAKILCKRLESINSCITIKYKNQAILPININHLLSKKTIVIDCTDNLATKYLINDYCNINRIPMVYGSLGQTEGQMTLFHNKSASDCHLRDIYPNPLHVIENCNQTGALNTIVGIIGLLQANETIKFIIHKEKALRNKLIVYDAMNATQLNIQLAKNYRELLTLPKDIELNYKYIKNTIKDYRVISLISEPKQIDLDFEYMHVSQALTSNWILLDKKVLLFCQNGNISRLVAEELHRKYKKQIFFSLKNGIQDLQNL